MLDGLHAYNRHGTDTVGRPSDDVTGQSTGDPMGSMAQRHTDLLYGWVVRRGRDPADAWDMVQDVFERALRTRPKVDNDHELRAWLLVVLRHRLVDEWRSANIRTIADCDLDAYVAPQKEPMALWRRVDIEAVYRLLPSLAPGLRATFELHAAGLSMAQISSRLAIPVGTVGTRLLRARAKLRDLLLNEDPDHA
jgi:RNA polymerase sigma-70 factor, ECF subfamily